MRCCPVVLCSRSITSCLCYYDHMCQSCSLSVTSLIKLVDRVLAAWTIHCWSAGPSRRLPPRIFHWMLGPLPRRSQQCSYPFLPAEQRSSPTVDGSTLTLLPKQRLLFGPHFAAAVIPLCSGLQFCLPPRSFLPPCLFLRTGQPWRLLPSTE
jgi:hypothetical protein